MILVSVIKAKNSVTHLRKPLLAVTDDIRSKRRLKLKIKLSAVSFYICFINYIKAVFITKLDDARDQAHTDS